LHRYALTKEMYDRLMEGRRRNLTDEPIHKRRDTPDTQTDSGQSLLDAYIAKEMDG
jgi:hypothetical protein